MRQTKEQGFTPPDLPQKYADELEAWFRAYPEPAKLPVGSFWDHLLDVHSLPEQVELRKVYNGQAGLEQDERNISDYARKALISMGISE